MGAGSHRAQNQDVIPPMWHVPAMAPACHGARLPPPNSLAHRDPVLVQPAVLPGGLGQPLPDATREGRVVWLDLAGGGWARCLALKGALAGAGRAELLGHCRQLLQPALRCALTRACRRCDQNHPSGCTSNWAATWLTLPRWKASQVRFLVGAPTSGEARKCSGVFMEGSTRSCGGARGGQGDSPTRLPVLAVWGYTGQPRHAICVRPPAFELAFTDS